MSFSIIKQVLAAAVADAGTFTVSYPSGKDEGHFFRAHGHKIVISGGSTLNFPEDFDVTLGTASITITNKTGAELAAGLALTIQIEEQGKRAFRDSGSSDRGTGELLLNCTEAKGLLINLGAPDVADADGVVVSQNLTDAGVFSVSVTAAAAIAAAALAGTFDVPRNVVAAWTTASVLTITGTDVHGNVMVESSASGTTMAGKKAFKTITDVSVSISVTGLTVGTGDVLGIPVFIPGGGHVVAEMEDGANATAGTVVGGDLTGGGATATTGDVRGTYDPNSAADGAKVFQLMVMLPDPGYIGVDQYAG